MYIPPSEKEERIKKRQNIAIYILLILNTVTLLNTWAKPLFLKEAPSTLSNPPLKDICYFGFSSLINKKADKNLLSKKISTFLEDNQYEIFDFENNTTINSIKIFNDGCYLITKDDLGLRGFTLKLIKSGPPFFYEIKDIEETPIKRNE